MNIAINYIESGITRVGKLEINQLARGQVTIKFLSTDKEFFTNGYNEFFALIELRRKTDMEGIQILCNGASMNVYQSGMMGDMGAGDKAYRLIEGLHATLKHVVNIFDFDPGSFIPGTVEEHEKYYDSWRRSKRKSSKIIPRYNLEWVVNNHNRNEKLEYLFFWGHRPNNAGKLGPSCLSQWWLCEFEKDSIKYSSAEQWMMAEKARLFLDMENLNKILSSQSPKEAKAYGRNIRHFNNQIWEDRRFGIVKEGNLLKFGQDKLLLEYLISTGNKILVEASPEDSIWGIGMSVDHQDIQDPNQWKGLNLLGFALMEVRDELVKNQLNTTI